VLAAAPVGVFGPVDLLLSVEDVDAAGVLGVELLLPEVLGVVEVSEDEPESSLGVVVVVEELLLGSLEGSVVEPSAKADIGIKLISKKAAPTKELF
jgi:hypothetical protein